MSHSVSNPLSATPARRIYLDHAATTPLCDAAIEAMREGLARWANPSSPHAEGRAARAALEGARARIKAALGWDGDIIFTSGASEAIALALGRTNADRIVVSPTEHDAVLRVAGEAAERLKVDEAGVALLSVRPEPVEGERASVGSARTYVRTLYAIQHVNNETGVIQPIAELAARIHEEGGVLLCDCAQSAGKIGLPTEADMIAISAHKFGGPPGVGALLVRDLGLLKPTGGQEQGYRGGTENLPGALSMAAALEQARDWICEAARLRAMLDTAIVEAGSAVVAQAAKRIPTIASYHMPGVSARAQLIRFDAAGIAVSAGAACSSGTLKTSPVLRALGWDERQADEVIRVSFGPSTTEADVRAFIEAWCGMARAKAA